MDSVDLVAFARKLIDIDSTTGREGAVARVLADELRALGYRVTLQPVADDRVNVIATIDEPVVEMAFTQASKPVVLSGAVEDGAEDSGFRYLLMPRRLLS